MIVLLEHPDQLEQERSEWERMAHAIGLVLRLGE